MKVEVIIKSGSDWVKRGMNSTMGVFGEPKKPLTDKIFRKLLVGRHSPIEEYEIWVDAIVPERVHTHVVRHKEIGKYVATSRPDIKYSTPIESGMRAMSLRFNAKRLIEICWQRLCTKAWVETIELFKMIAEEVIKVDPVLGDYLVPSCVWMGFCPEGSNCITGTNKYIDARGAFLRNAVVS